MVDISNRTLALLLVAAVVVSLGSTVVSLNKLDSVSLTGLVTEDATADLEIEGSIAIEFIVDSMNFGVGFAEDTTSDGQTVCVVASEGTVNASGSCRNFNIQPDPFRIRNIGNQIVQLEIASNATAAQFITGGGSGFASPDFEYQVRDAESGSCSGTAQTYTSLTGGGTFQPGCTAFEFATANDELFIDLRLTIPSDASIGARSATITAEATT